MPRSGPTSTLWISSFTGATSMMPGFPLTLRCGRRCCLPSSGKHAAILISIGFGDTRLPGNRALALLASEQDFEPETNETKRRTHVRQSLPVGTNWKVWLRGLDLNQRPSGYEPDELPDCSTPRHLSGVYAKTAIAAVSSLHGTSQPHMQRRSNSHFEREGRMA